MSAHMFREKRGRCYFPLPPIFGQSTLEYVILLALVLAALVAMHTYVNRALKANLEVMDKQLTAAPLP